MCVHSKTLAQLSSTQYILHVYLHMQARIQVKEGSYNEDTEDSTLWSHLTIVLIQHPPKWITLSQILPHSLHPTTY